MRGCRAPMGSQNRKVSRLSGRSWALILGSCRGPSDTPTPCSYPKRRFCPGVDRPAHDPVWSMDGPGSGDGVGARVDCWADDGSVVTSASGVSTLRGDGGSPSRGRPGRRRHRTSAARRPTPVRWSARSSTATCARRPPAWTSCPQLTRTRTRRHCNSGRRVHWTRKNCARSQPVHNRPRPGAGPYTATKGTYALVCDCRPAQVNTSRPAVAPRSRSACVVPLRPPRPAAPRLSP
jgi:hypothetical protein